MRSIFNLSFRYKIPLWGSFLIITTALAVSGSLMVRAYQDLKTDLVMSSASLGRTLATTLVPTLLHDDVWRAFQIVNAPISAADAGNPVNPETILVLDNALRVVVSTRPKTIPMLADMRSLSPGYAALAKKIAGMDKAETQTVELPGSKRLYVLTPITDGGAHIGMLVIVHSTDKFVPRFLRAALGGALIGLLVLSLLLPMNWYWGQRMALPLVQLASGMGEIGRRRPVTTDFVEYPYQDELGQLSGAYRHMIGELAEKDAMEKQMVQSDRLAAVGHLAAGVAHEINNPLGGMFAAIDTLKIRGELDARTMKTISLIERGLGQIKETVGALLVEARMKSRDFAPRDLEDVRSLVSPQAHEKSLRLDWDTSMAGPLPLPANLIRQILINLLLNAIQAADHRVRVACVLEQSPASLRLTVENDGKLLTPEQMPHLFEPFSPLSKSGHGLGLWVTYQIVQQLGGHIAVDRKDERMSFSVWLPLGEGA